MVKVELDGCDRLTVREREVFSTTLETAATLEGELKETRAELKEARAEVQAWKSTSEADKAKHKSSRKEIERHMEALRGAHDVVKDLEKEKFALMKRNNQIEHSETNVQAEVEKVKEVLEWEWAIYAIYPLF